MSKKTIILILVVLDVVLLGVVAVLLVSRKRPQIDQPQVEMLADTMDVQPADTVKL